MPTNLKVERKPTKRRLLFPLCVLVAGCGGSSDSFQRAFVTDVRVDPDQVRVGEEISVRVDFDPSQSETQSGSDGETTTSLEDSTVVIRLPEGVDYVTGSSEFDGSDVGGFRTRGPNHVEICSDGSRALTYQFTAGEQTDNENSIRLTAKAFENVGTVTFGAEADDFIADACSVGIEDTDQLLVTG
ncbi:MAG: hypothetical protein U0136_22175 [Bdellovibrionota bacterium]